MALSDTKVTKRIIDTTAGGEEDERALDVPALATILVTSEDPEHPVDHIFSRHEGGHGRKWVAAEVGKQCLIIDFDKPQTLRGITIEIIEEEKSRSQELIVSVSDDGGKTYRDLFCQQFNFSPPGTTREKEQWLVPEQRITHLRFWLDPDKNGGDAKATVTSLRLY
jgi:hypothetical protein